MIDKYAADKKAERNAAKKLNKLREKEEKVNKLRKQGVQPDAEVAASLKKLPEQQRELDAIRAAIATFEEDHPEEVKLFEGERDKEFEEKRRAEEAARAQKTEAEKQVAAAQA